MSMSLNFKQAIFLENNPIGPRKKGKDSWKDQKKDKISRCRKWECFSIFLFVQLDKNKNKEQKINHI